MSNLLLQQSSLYDQAMQRLRDLYTDLCERNAHTMGYPVSKEFDYSLLAPFLKLPLNNIGDPYQSGTYGVHTRELETEVVDFFAHLFRAEVNNYWGYVTNGGTEGNLYGLYLARNLFPTGKVYFSRAAHYGIRKNSHVLGMDYCEIDTKSDDTIDIDRLLQSIDKERPVIVVANIGSTMREAKDDIRLIRSNLQALGISDIYIHSDAALCGATAPFLAKRPAFDFADGCDSIAVSGHKFIGCPIPCGVVVCKREFIDQTSQYVPYIDGYDHTITGSRNGLTPLLLWYQIMCLGKAGLQERVDRCLSRAAWAQQKLQNLGIAVERGEDALTIVFPRPGPEVVEKWQLACEADIAHMICMPHVSLDQLREFVADLSSGIKQKPPLLTKTSGTEVFL